MLLYTRRITVKNCSACKLSHDFEIIQFNDPIVDSDGTVCNGHGVCVNTASIVLFKFLNGDEDSNITKN